MSKHCGLHKRAINQILSSQGFGSLLIVLIEVADLYWLATSPNLDESPATALSNTLVSSSKGSCSNNRKRQPRYFDISKSTLPVYTRKNYTSNASLFLICYLSYVEINYVVGISSKYAIIISSKLKTKPCQSKVYLSKF